MPFFAVKVSSSMEPGSGMCRRAGGLLSLPLDTLIQVLSLTPPMDILAVRLTCKHLMIASCQRIVWINALRLVCMQRGIYTHSFPVKDMSVPQLEHAATSPFRFVNLLRRSAANSTSIPPVAIRLLQPRLPKGMTGDSGIFDSSYLVPGGRYLLTRSTRNVLQLWDLGYSADMMIKPENVACHHLGEAELQFDPDAQLTQDGQGILIFLASQNVFRIFEVYPLSDSPTFKQVASIDVVLGGRCVYIFTDKLIIYYMNRRVTVWNYINDTISTWLVRSSPVWDISVSDTHVTLLDQSAFHVYRIPPLQPRNAIQPDAASPHSSSSHLPTLAPLVSVPYPISSVLKVADNWSWYTSANDSRPIHFDILGVGSASRSPHNTSSYIYSLNNPSYNDTDAIRDDQEDGLGSSYADALVIARYTLRKVDNDIKDGLPEYMPVLLEHIHLGGHFQPLVDHARSVRTGSRDLILMWPSLQGRKLNVYYSDLEGQSDNQVHSLPSPSLLHDPVGALLCPSQTRPRPHLASLEISGSFSGEVICCPFSGRVCCIDEQGVAHVIDYIQPVGMI